MKNILLFLIPIILGISQVSAETGATNVAPVAIDDVAITNEDVPVIVNVLANDTDADWDTLSVTWVYNVNNWTAVNIWTGVVFTPTAYFYWTWSFEYTLSDGTLTDTWKVLITVNPVNNWPVAVDDTFTVDVNSTTTLNLVANDTDVESNHLHVVSIGNILNWTWTITASGVVFKPNVNFIWVISFSYVVSDGNLTDTWMVLVSVKEKNSDPIAVIDLLVTEMNKSKTIDPRVNDIDKDKDALAITSVTQPTHGNVTFTSVSVTYTPTTNYKGSDMFKYTVSDWKWGTSTWQINVSVKEHYEDDDNYEVKPHVVQSVQKEFIAKFKELKDEYKDLKSKQARTEYLTKKKELREEYLQKLKSVTWPEKKTNYEIDSEKEKYKSVYKTKYWKKISQMTDRDMIVIIWKIDTLLAQINNSTSYSSDTKQKLTTMLIALKELIQNK